VRLPGSKRSTLLEAYVATNLSTQSWPQTHAPERATDLQNDWSNVPPPATLLLKFPGTGGRAERSSTFPAHLIPAHRHNLVTDPSGHFETWVCNAPGYGGSHGPASLTALVPAAEAFASQVLAARCGKSTQVWLCGNSLGCLSAMSLAARVQEWLPPMSTPPRFKLWLQNPPDLANVILRVADRYAARFFMRRIVRYLPEQLSMLHNASQSKWPAVFLMSQLDTLVLPEIQRSIHAAYGGPHRVVTLTGLEHSGKPDQRHAAELGRAADWLSMQ
jgi:pimeloyl-ACP methyl ester carboxylesterase